jgi:calcium-dependent protein kinase
VELEKNHGRKFDDYYVTSKLIGHGAFAKVSICTDKETKEKYAVKTVQKNLEDPGKQREGGSGTCCHCDGASCGV